MTLICTYPLERSSLIYQRIVEAIEVVSQATGNLNVRWNSAFSGEWVTTVAGFPETDEMQLKLKLCGHCCIKQV